MASNEKDLGSIENPLPKWLNEEYFQDILSKEYSNYEILKFVTKSAVPAGENFGSKIYRTQIELKLSDGTRKNVSYIIKTVSPDENEKKIIDKMGLFVKEVKMYENYIPKFESLYQKFGVNIKLAPKQFKLSSNVLVTEDLKGYEIINRQKCFDLKQSEAVLEKLAKFHAASVCIYEEEGPYADNFFEGFFSENSKDVYNRREGNPEIFADCMRKWGTCSEYIDKMKNFLYKLYELASKPLKYNPNIFNVLNHGDLWINNIMFKYDQNNQKFIDLQLIDFQLCRWGSPAEDLNCFIMTSCSTEIKVKYFDYLIKYYHDQLISNLKLLKYSKPLPKLRDLHCDVIQCGHYAVACCTSLSLMPASLLDASKDATSANFYDKNDTGLKLKQKIFLNPRFIRAMEVLLPFFDNRGLLDD